MKGVVLAGGLGTRFHPVTKVVNKHLLDVFDEPMVYYPLRMLAKAGIEEVTLVTGAEIDQFRSLLGSGDDLGLQISYAQQEGESGIADALSKARSFVGADSMVVVLGDNIFQEDLSPFVQAYEQQGRGARLLLKEVASEDAQRFGCAEFDNGNLKGIVEKPSVPPSNLVVTGCYMYDSRVFEIIDGLVPSARDEYEITDVNNHYIDLGECEADVIKGWWTDAGTPASKLKASILVALAKGVTFHA